MEHNTIEVRSHTATPIGYIPPSFFPWGTRERARRASMDLYFTSPQCYVNEKQDRRVYLYRGREVLKVSWDRWSGVMVFEYVFKYSPGQEVHWVNSYGRDNGKRTIVDCVMEQRGPCYHITPHDAPWYAVEENELLLISGV
jgi:hypothetical protein